MKFNQTLKAGLITLFLIFLIIAPNYAQKGKLGYINTQKILSSYKEALDAQKKIDEFNQQWEKEVADMQRQLDDLRNQFDSQSLLLSEMKKAEMAKEIQDLNVKIQQFYQDKWAPGTGQVYKRQEEVMEPILGKIIAVVKKFGEEEGFDYIFDTVNGNILFASTEQEDLTDRVLEELNKGLAVKEEKGN